MLLLLLPGVLASSSVSYNLTDGFVSGTVDGSGGTYDEVGVLGQMVVGNGSSASFLLVDGILGPASYVESPVPSGTGAGAGGAGCAEGFWKNEFGECVRLEEVPVVEPVDKQNYLPYLLLVSGVVIFVFAYLRNERKREIERRAKEIVKENDKFK